MCFALLSDGNTEDSVVGEVLLTCIFKGCTSERALVCARGELPSLRILTVRCFLCIFVEEGNDGSFPA